MKVREVMTSSVISVNPDASVADMAKLMEKHLVSGLPVIDNRGKLVGMVTASDCLHRAETGTQVKRSGWRAFLDGPEKMAVDYIHSHGRKVSEIMTTPAITVTEETELEEAIHLLEKRQIHRLPVVRDGVVTGILSRSNLVQSLASIIRGAPSIGADDAILRDKIRDELDKITWAAREFINVTVRDGVVDLWGSYTALHQDEAAVVAAENVPGVKAVRNHLAWVDPMSGLVVYSPVP